MSTPPDSIHAPDSVLSEDLTVAMRACACLTYEDAAAVIAAYREKIINEARNEHELSANLDTP